MKKKILSFVMTIAMIFSITTFSQATEAGNYVDEAQQLKILGVFQGTSSGFELTRQPTRLEGLIMLIRLLGVESDAKAMADDTCVFTDVSNFGKGYVNYAYKNGLTNGVGNHLFGSSGKANALSYTTFLLRALGYSDSTGDFTYSDSLKFAQKIGLYSAADISELTSTTFLRDHIAKTSMLALGTKIKSGSQTLFEKLVNQGVISQEAAKQINPEAFASLEVSYIDVGQADSILIKKGSHAMLIDGGNVADGDTVVDYIKAKGITTLDYVVGTHPHEDHIGGLTDVIKTFNVSNVIMPSAVTTTNAYKNLLNAISSKNLSITKPVYGTSYNLGGAAFTILAPNSDSYDDLNDYSVVLRLVNGFNSFLFTGDAGTLSESEMLSKNSAILKSDVLKVGHHGSSTATSQAFLNAVNPKYAIISVGVDNDYGLPDQEVIDRLTAKNISVFRTDEQGTIVSTSNGHTIVFNQNPVSNETPTSTSSSSGESSSSGGSTNKNVIISSVDKVNEIVTIKNTGTTNVDISGWTLVSVTGNQTYTIPSYVLKAGATVTIASGDASGDLKWTSANVWNNSSSDPAKLLDTNGNVVCSYAS